MRGATATMREPVIGFGERLAMFWANHFAVAVSKRDWRFASSPAPSSANGDPKPHLFGRFEDMLLAVETHPAMLAFLDNRQSIGPRQPRRRALLQRAASTKNLAREIMELATLGVDGGYSQRDVTALARVITGWTVERGQKGPQGAPLGQPGTFVFNPNAHEPGAQSVLGVSYPDNGVEQGRAAAGTALSPLIRRPRSTSRPSSRATSSPTPRRRRWSRASPTPSPAHAATCRRYISP